MLVPDPTDLLGGETQGLVPGGLTESAIPSRRSRHPIPDVVLAQLRQTGQGRFSDLSKWWSRFLSVPHLLDGEPGTFPIPGPFAGPNPLPILTHPTLADEWRGEPVPVLGEVVPEPSFDAGR